MEKIISLYGSYTDCIHNIEYKYSSKIGYIYFVLANFFYTILNMNIGRVSSVPHFQLFYLRVLWPTVIFYFSNRAQGLRLFSHSPKINKLMVLNGLIYLVGGSSIFYGFQVVPLSEATVIFQTNPAVSGILAALLLNEAYDVIQFAITVLCTLGVILIAKPAFLFESYAGAIVHNPQRVEGIISLLIGSLMIGLMSIVIKAVVTHVEPNLSAFYIGLIPSLFGSLFVLTEGAKFPDYNETLIISYIVVLGYLAQVYYNRAFKFGDAGKISIMAYSQIIFGYILDVFVIGTIPDFYSMVGAVFIFSCMFLRIYKTSKEDLSQT